MTVSELNEIVRRLRTARSATITHVDSAGAIQTFHIGGHAQLPLADQDHGNMTFTPVRRFTPKGWEKV